MDLIPSEDKNAKAVVGVTFLGGVGAVGESTPFELLEILNDFLREEGSKDDDDDDNVYEHIDRILVSSTEKIRNFGSEFGKRCTSKYGIIAKSKIPL